MNKKAAFSRKSQRFCIYQLAPFCFIELVSHQVFSCLREESKLFTIQPKFSQTSVNQDNFSLTQQAFEIKAVYVKGSFNLDDTEH